MDTETTPRPGGHPRHQLRTFTVTARRSNERARTIRVTAQTERDALLRAGLALAGETAYPDPGEWRVTGVTDPAPYTWCPDDAGAARDHLVAAERAYVTGAGTGEALTAAADAAGAAEDAALPAPGKIRFEAFDVETGQRWATSEWDQADRPRLTAYVTRTTARGRSRVTLTFADGKTRTYPRGE